MASPVVTTQFQAFCISYLLPHAAGAVWEAVMGTQSQKHRYLEHQPLLQLIVNSLCSRVSTFRGYLPISAPFMFDIAIYAWGAYELSGSLAVVMGLGIEADTKWACNKSTEHPSCRVYPKPLLAS